MKSFYTHQSLVVIGIEFTLKKTVCILGIFTKNEFFRTMNVQIIITKVSQVMAHLHNLT